VAGIIGIIQTVKVATTPLGSKHIEAVVDAGGGDLVTADYFAPSGYEFEPLEGDYVLMVPMIGTGRWSIMGTIDPGLTDRLVQSGDTRIYARNAAGDIVASVWVRSTGEIQGFNDNGYFRLRSDGVVEANNATIPTDGDVITSDGISLRNHTHPQPDDSGGNTEADTGAPNP